MRTNTRHSSADLLEKLKASGRYTPISDDEYQRLQREQFARLDQTAQEHRQAVHASFTGLKPDELFLDWSAVQPDISDATKARDAVREKYQAGFGLVFLWGSWGQGKTLVGKILVATAHREGRRATYANMSAVLDDIRLAFDDKESKTTELLRRMAFWTSRDVLFLDELDKVNDTSWARERIFELLDQRYMRAIREEALTVIASNSKVDALDGYLQSRLKDRRLGPVVYLHGPDGRAVMPEGYRF